MSMSSDPTLSCRPLAHATAGTSALGHRATRAGLDLSVGDTRTVAPPTAALKFVSWNCRGKGKSLHNSRKMEYLARLMYSTGAQVTFVSETRSSKCTDFQLNARFNLSSSFVVPSKGRSGGTLVALD